MVFLSSLGPSISNRRCDRTHHEDAEDVDSQLADHRTLRAAQVPRQAGRLEEEDRESHRSRLHGERYLQRKLLSLRRMRRQHQRQQQRVQTRLFTETREKNPLVHVLLLPLRLRKFVFFLPSPNCAPLPLPVSPPPAHPHKLCSKGFGS